MHMVAVVQSSILSNLIMSLSSIVHLRWLEQSPPSMPYGTILTDSKFPKVLMGKLLMLVEDCGNCHLIKGRHYWKLFALLSTLIFTAPLPDSPITSFTGGETEAQKFRVFYLMAGRLPNHVLNICAK